MYRLDQVKNIAGRLDQVASRILRTRRNLMIRPPEQIRPYLRRVGFEYVAYMVEFEHDWSLVSALIERWRPESYTFHLSCGEMTITLQDVAYQLGLKIDGDPVRGCIGVWEQHHQGRTIRELCEQILGIVSGPEDRQSQTKWIVKLIWFHNTVCGELEQDATEERLMRYTRGYIMQLIGGILFPDASDSRVHIRWLPLLEDLDACRQLSWGSTVLA
ncbi:protein MAIN-LIKE 1-like [Arachis stenosperma]|uniref:protein MAIN-LIKE 1-like n=1 Tax=Arachis stenosperma TaxID=217475 RepID=UPI0025ACCD20|nr:protein MAIN-LIKE 1-like [Arachis stenosperma]